MWVLCLNLVLLDNQTDKGIAQSNCFFVKLAPHFWKGDERENKGTEVMGNLCASLLGPSLPLEESGLEHPRHH